MSAVALANEALVEAGFEPVFKFELVHLSDHKQYGGEFEGQTLRKVFQPVPFPHMAMILMSETPRVVTLKRGAQDLI